MKIDRDFARDTLVRLVRINSINPTLAQGAPGEREVAGCVAGALRECSMAAEIFEPEAGRCTAFGRRSGTGGGRSLLLYAHGDTVAAPGMSDPFSGAIREGKVYGRGAFDMKGGLAACLAAAKAIADAGVRLRGDLLVAAVADEEYGSLGTRDLIARVRPHGAIVAEPSDLHVCVAHKGYLWIQVDVAGRAAHGSRFDLGIDANMKMGALLAALAELERELRGRPPHPLVGPPSLHAATLRGGVGLSTYAPSSTLQLERRTIPGETQAQAVAEIQAIVDRLAAADENFHATVDCFFARQPFEVADDAPIVRTADRAVETVLGRKPAHTGETGWLDSALLQAAGIETVICGPTGEGAHGDCEWVNLDSVFQLAEILAEAALEYCA